MKNGCSFTAIFCVGMLVCLMLFKDFLHPNLLILCRRKVRITDNHQNQQTMKHLLLFVILFGAFGWAQAQKKADNLLPGEESKVTREYDEKGNLIRFDSTFVKSWSLDTTLNSMDWGSIREQMDSFFGQGFGRFFSDTTLFGDNPFGDLYEHFHDREPGIFDSFSFFDNDSMMLIVPDSMGFQTEFGHLRQEMMRHFGQFFPVDSLRFHQKGIPDTEGFDFFFSPEDIAKLQKEMEEHFAPSTP